MIAPFEFQTSGRILFGAGTAGTLPRWVAGLGSRPLLVTGGDPSRHEEVLAAVWVETGPPPVVLTIAAEPTVEDIERGVAQAKREGCDVVLAVGGGSALDAAKAVAALVANPGDPLDYLEVIGRGAPLRFDALPVVAVPTTSGTGSEVTRNAVLKSTAHAVKVSLRSPSMLPKVTVVDPALTLTLPRSVTIACGLDALTQVIEPFVSNRANPMTDALCRDGIARGARALPRVVEHPGDVDARADMSLTSLLGGLALANAKLGAVHGFAGPLGGMLDAPHGAICARLLPGVMEANVTALQSSGDPSHTVWVHRFEEVARLVTGRTDATIAAGVAWISDLVGRLGVPGLGVFGMTADLIPEAVEKSRRSSSMKGNPIELAPAELARILREAM